MVLPVIHRKQMELAPIFLMADRLAALERENKRLREENSKKRPHGDGEALRLGRPRRGIGICDLDYDA